MAERNRVRSREARGARAREVLVLAAVAAAGCVGNEEAPIRCAAVDPQASIIAAGVYRYASPEFALSGTITFAQEGSLVRVTDTTYDRGSDRALAGGATLAGNRLDVELTPKNGDTNYTAQVQFVFSDGGRRFCLLGFSDTNGDTGQEGSYLGALLSSGHRGVRP
jgi:hypothetical protein